MHNPFHLYTKLLFFIQSNGVFFPKIIYAKLAKNISSYYKNIRFVFFIFAELTVYFLSSMKICWLKKTISFNSNKLNIILLFTSAALRAVVFHSQFRAQSNASARSLPSATVFRIHSFRESTDIEMLSSCFWITAKS